MIDATDRPDGEPDDPDRAPTANPAYDPPTITMLGSLADLTLGTGEQSDGIGPGSLF